MSFDPSSCPAIRGPGTARGHPAIIPVAALRPPGQEPKPVAVAVLATDAILGAGAAAYLSTQPGLATLPATSAHEADVILVLDELGADQTLAWMRRMASRAAHRENRFVVISDQATGPQLQQATECGLVSVLPRLGCDYGRIIEAIRRLDQGRVELPGPQVRTLLAQLPPQPGEPPARAAAPEPGAPGAVQLSSREREILRLLADGSGTAEIAASLSYSESTIKNIIQKLLIRLQLRNRSHAVAFALRNGLL